MSFLDIIQSILPPYLFPFFKTKVSQRMKNFYGMKSLCVLMIVMVVIVNETHSVEAVKCDTKELRVCIWPFTMSVKPSTACCNKLKEHRSCYCEYKKKSKVKPYLQYDAAKKLLSRCGVVVPTC